MVKIENIRLDGGSLCLDFINTVHDRFENPQVDYLNTMSDLLKWSEKACIVQGKQLKGIKEELLKNTKDADRFLDRAIKFRELLYSLFLELAHNRKIDTKNLQAFNYLLSQSLSRMKLVENQGFFSQAWNLAPEDPERLILSVAKDAYELLLLNKPKRIKECPKCGWLFFDTSKNGRRKWCSMETCGSREKAINWYRRNKT